MNKEKVVLTDYLFKTIDPIRKVFENTNIEFVACQTKDEKELLEITKDADGVLTQYAPITREVIKNMTKCQLIVRIAVGVDTVDLKAASECGIYVANVPDYGIDDVADHTILLMLAAAKKLWLMANSVKNGIWDVNLANPVYRIKNKTLSLLGFGKIARNVANKAKSFGMRVIACDQYLNDECFVQHGVERVNFDTLIRQADFLSLHLPLKDSTKHIINLSTFKNMKKTAYIINTARGLIIDEQALIEALQDGLICGAALDVLAVEKGNKAHPFNSMDNVIVTPHSSWYSEEGELALLTLPAEEMVRVLSGEKPRNPVNII